MAGGVKVVVKEEVLLGERSGGLECYCVVMINVSQIFLFILTGESVTRAACCPLSASNNGNTIAQ